VPPTPYTEPAPRKRREMSWAERGRTDSRGGDRHKSRTDKRRGGDRHKTRPALRFAGVDGESVKGRYTLLAAATDDGAWDDWIENPDGLSTRDCLTFLTSFPTGLRCWGFAFGYDVNMLLVDLKIEQVSRLYEEGAVYWREFRIAYTPGKKLTVTRYRTAMKGADKIASVTVWDMFTWIQTSFATWIQSWELAPPNEIERIVNMKAQRATFTAEQHAEIKRYCLSECRYLAAGARRLVDLIGAADVKVTTYYSPATVSKALLAREHVVAFRSDPPDEIASAIDAAYAGGRAEVSMIGPVSGPLYQYDIRSAYPAAAIDLPCLAHGRWRHGGPRSTVKPWSLCRVSWRPLKGNPSPTWGPLPIRPRTGSLRWPTHGTGWYWGVEVLAARRHAQIDVKDVWTFTPGCDHKPFAYLTDLYHQRAERKAAGDPSEFVLKLALNATYGALAEHPHKAQKNPPKFRCLAWAGWITAATRARLLDVLSDDVVLMATDCVLSRSELDVPIGDGLGEWEVKKYDEMFIAGTGIYYGLVGGRWTTTKTRGFESGTLTREMLTRLWKKQGRAGRVRMVRHRFIGMGTALHRIRGFYPPHTRLWRQFVDEPVDKTLDVEPRRTWVVADAIHDGRSQAPTLAAHRLTERDDRARLARLESDYARKVATWERIVAKDPNMPTKYTGIKMQRALLMLAGQITAAKREGASVFEWSDDPALG
jgi:hypothetical protein